MARLSSQIEVRINSEAIKQIAELKKQVLDLSSVVAGLLAESTLHEKTKERYIRKLREA